MFLLKPWLLRLLFSCWVAVWAVAISGAPVQAATLDPYVAQFLQATQPVAIAVDDQGGIRLFSPDQLTEGKHLFSENCKSCHLGGATLPNPLVSLSLEDLRGAVPRRDNVASLVAYQRLPMSYDGSEENFGCRQVMESWLSDEQLQDLAAFILRAAEKSPRWGSETFE